MEYQSLILEREDHIVFVTIARPERLNALDHTTLLELDRVFSELADDEGVRCVVVTGAEGKAFVAGADINELGSLNTVSQALQQAEYGHGVFFRIDRFPKPVIIAINGYALGGGCELAMAGDIRIAAETAKLGFPEINLGIHPGWGGTQRLPHLVGLSRAKRLIFTGESISAQEAWRIGLVDEVVPADRLLASTKELATKLAEKAPSALRLAKLSLNASVGADLEAGCQIEAACFAAVCSTQDRVEGVQAFLEKRRFSPRGR